MVNELMEKLVIPLKVQAQPQPLGPKAPPLIALESGTSPSLGQAKGLGGGGSCGILQGNGAEEAAAMATVA